MPKWRLAFLCTVVLLYSLYSFTPHVAKMAAGLSVYTVQLYSVTSFIFTELCPRGQNGGWPFSVQFSCTLSPLSSLQSYAHVAKMAVGLSVYSLVVLCHLFHLYRAMPTWPKWRLVFLCTIGLIQTALARRCSPAVGRRPYCLVFFIFLASIQTISVINRDGRTFLWDFAFRVPVPGTRAHLWLLKCASIL